MPHNSKNLSLSLFGCLLLAIPQYASAAFVKGSFNNIIRLSTEPTQGAISAPTAFFNGHSFPLSSGGNSSQTEGRYRLVSASFGQMVGHTALYPHLEKTVIDQTIKRLDKAFAYKALLYGQDGSGNIESRFDTILNHWNDTKRNQAINAASYLKGMLVSAPYSKTLRWKLLDIFYDIAVADKAKANQLLVEAQKIVLGLGYTPPPGEFYIDKEIEAVKKAWVVLRTSTKLYFDFLSTPLPIGNQAGYEIFKAEVPGRSLFSALKKDQSIINTQESDAKPLFTGYKDLVLLFELEKDTVQTANQLVRLYAMRGRPGLILGGDKVPSDNKAAKQLLLDQQQTSYLNGVILSGIFSSEDLDSVNSKSGLNTAIAGWQQGLNGLNHMVGFLEGHKNPLGFDKDFLALVQDRKGNELNFTDSFDAFKSTLLPGGNPSGSLEQAITAYEKAREDYRQLRINEDTLKESLSNQRRLFADRLRSIVGTSQLPDLDNPSEEYKHPENNKGGEIYAQIKVIEEAQLEIKRADEAFRQMEGQIIIETERRNQQGQINDQIKNIYIDFGEKQVTLTNEIARYKAVQAAAQAAANATKSLVSAFNPVNLVNPM